MLMRHCTQNNTGTQSADYFIQEQKDSLCIIQWGESYNLSAFTKYFSPYNKPFSTDSKRKGEREGKKLRQLYQKFTKYMQTLCLSWKGNPFRGVNNGHFVGFQMQLHKCGFQMHLHKCVCKWLSLNSPWDLLTQLDKRENMK